MVQTGAATVSARAEMKENPDYSRSGTVVTDYFSHSIISATLPCRDGGGLFGGRGGWEGKGGEVCDEMSVWCVCVFYVCM